VSVSRPTPKRASVSDRVAHYAGKCEPIDLIVARGFGEGFAAGNVIKYVSRYAEKNGVDDLLKAKDYLELLIEMASRKAAAPAAKE